MKNITIYFSIFFLFCFAFISCQKIELRPSDANTSLLQKNANTIAGSSLLLSADYVPQDDDSIERPTILGMKLTNPYLIPNMRQAYADLGLSMSKAVINNLYVRFLPSGIDQLAVLDSTMDAQGLELFDTPVDYEVIYEGDYYQDPSIPDEQITWQYAVVPPTFQFPTGIQYETLAQIHIPDDNYTAIETEAETLAALNDGGGDSANSMVQPNSPECGFGYYYDYHLHMCVLRCSEGFHWDGTKCMGDTPPLDPPAPASDAAIPAGYIYVHDTNLPNIAGSNVPVRKVRVVARRWFKIQRVYTDNNGHFVFTKPFKHKVRIIEKFKNSDAYIYGIRGVRAWQMLFPVKRTLGVYSGDKSNIQFSNNQEGPVNSKGNRYWTAATAHNAVQEHRDYAATFGFSAAPTTMNIYLTNWGITQGLVY